MSIFPKTFAIITGAICLVSTLGCGASRPRFFGPQGSSEVQRFRATVHDPYPSNDLGPEIVGGRPREYQKAQPEPVSSQPFGRRSPTGAYWGPPPVYAPPAFTPPQ